MESVFIRKSWVPGKGFVAANKMIGADRAALRSRIGQRRTERKGYGPYGGIGRSSSIRFDDDAYLKNATSRHAMTFAANNFKSRATPVPGRPGRSVINTDINGGNDIAGDFTYKAGRRDVILGHSPKSQKSNNRSIAHEMEHVRPKRNAHRLYEISQDPAKLGREEARADWMSGAGNAFKRKGRNSGYAEAAGGSSMAAGMLNIMSGGRMGDDFVGSYRKMQETFKAKGIKNGIRAKKNNAYAQKNFGVQDRPDNLMERLRDKLSR